MTDVIQDTDSMFRSSLLHLPDLLPGVVIIVVLKDFVQKVILIPSCKYSYFLPLVLEEMNKTLEVLEDRFPTFFSGASEVL